MGGYGELKKMFNDVMWISFQITNPLVLMTFRVPLRFLDLISYNYKYACVCPRDFKFQKCYLIASSQFNIDAIAEKFNIDAIAKKSRPQGPENIFRIIAALD